MKPVYSVPKLVKYDDLSKGWYVYFRYNKKLFKYTNDINRIKEYKKRLFAGEALAKAFHEKLKEGWNPLVPDLDAIEGQDMTFYQALEFALEKKKPNLAPKSYSGYIGTVRFVKTAVRALNIGYLPIVDTKRVHIKTILENIKKERLWSNAAYNKHLHHLQAVLSELIQWDIIEVNPAHKIKPLPVLDTKANIPPTRTQNEEIKYHLKRKSPGLYQFLSVLFHTGIRPAEICQIRYSMINVNARLITLPAHITKTNKDRIVPINEHLYDDLKERLIPYPDHYYLFGSDRTSGKGNIGLHIDFRPGPTKMNRDTVTVRWNRLVKIQLGINVNMYAYKHFGADMKILAGVELPALSELYGHTSTVMTEKYARKVKEVYRKQILEMSPKL